MARPARDPSLDALRGVAVLGMLVVDLPGDPATTFPALTHAAWHGLTLADLVFPAFLVTAGMAIPMGRASSIRDIVRRSATLILIGLALGFALHPSLAPAELRWLGVLQRVGIVYLTCALIGRALPGVLWPLLVAAFLLAAHTVVILYLPAPGEAAASLVPGQGISAWLDRQMLPGRLHRTVYDPEGVLSTLPAIASGLLGLCAMRIARGGGSALGFALLILLLGLGATAIVPLNKSLWTASFALVTSGVALSAWRFLDRLSRRAPIGRVLTTLAEVGQTALTIYVLHMLLIAVMIRPWQGGTVWQSLFTPFRATALTPPMASLTFALALTFACSAFALVLYKRGIRLSA